MHALSHELKHAHRRIRAHTRAHMHVLTHTHTPTHTHTHTRARARASAHALELEPIPVLHSLPSPALVLGPQGLSLEVLLAHKLQGKGREGWRGERQRGGTQGGGGEEEGRIGQQNQVSGKLPEGSSLRGTLGYSPILDRSILAKNGSEKNP